MSNLEKLLKEDPGNGNVEEAISFTNTFEKINGIPTCVLTAFLKILEKVMEQKVYKAFTRSIFKGVGVFFLKLKNTTIN